MKNQHILLITLIFGGLQGMDSPYWSKDNETPDQELSNIITFNKNTTTITVFNNSNDPVHDPRNQELMKQLFPNAKIVYKHHFQRIIKNEYGYYVPYCEEKQKTSTISSKSSLEKDMLKKSYESKKSQSVNSKKNSNQKTESHKNNKVDLKDLIGSRVNQFIWLNEPNKKN